MIFLPVMPMPMPRTISPKIRKMIDLFTERIRMKVRCDFFKGETSLPGSGKLRSHTGHFSAVRAPGDINPESTAD